MPLPVFTLAPASTPLTRPISGRGDWSYHASGMTGEQRNDPPRSETPAVLRFDWLRPVRHAPWTCVYPNPGDGRTGQRTCLVIYTDHCILAKMRLKHAGGGGT